MKKVFQRIQKSPIFKFASSVKMAVLLLLTLGVVVAAGTIYESMYNAQVAGILVYHTAWFLGLLTLLWLNILFAALSRIPFRKHHTGFVITHIGLLTLFIGAAITYFYGIDGQLSVEEGGKSHLVGVSDYVVKAVREGSDEIHAFPVSRGLKKQELRVKDFSAYTGLTIQEYLPFVSKKATGRPSLGPGIVLGFGLQSQFFNVSETLHSAENSELQMGPAKIRIVEDLGDPASSKANTESVKKKNDAPILTVTDAKSGNTISAFSLGQIGSQGIIVRGAKVELVKEYRSAKVSKNHLVEGSGSNPALELKISKDQEAVREVAFQNFPTFSLNPDGVFGLKFLLSGITDGESTKEGERKADLDRRGNVIEFHVSRTNLSSANLQLFKDNSRVLGKAMKPGETVVTPWMGMKVTMLDLKWTDGGSNSGSDEVVSVELPARDALPPSAIRINGQWLVEGDAKIFDNGKEKFEVYYGSNSVDLPFDIQLHKFEKVDYPGTEMALSFQSLVSVNEEGKQFLIKMNEPLVRDGYMIYQSSFLLEPGQKPISVFSVNHDPGRWIKYLGAVILVMGIFLFIVMRTKWYLQLSAAKGKVSS